MLKRFRVSFIAVALTVLVVSLLLLNLAFAGAEEAKQRVSRTTVF